MVFDQKSSILMPGGSEYFSGVSSNSSTTELDFLRFLIFAAFAAFKSLHAFFSAVLYASIFFLFLLKSSIILTYLLRQILAEFFHPLWVLPFAAVRKENFGASNSAILSFSSSGLSFLSDFVIFNK